VELGPDGRPTLAVDVPLRSHRTIQARFSGEIPSGFDADVKRKGEGRVLHVHNGLPRRLRDLVVVRAGPDGRAQFRSLGNLEVNGTVEADLGPGSWSPLSSPLVDPFNDAAGLFSRGGGPFAGGAQFAPADDTEAADTDARERMARAALGASVADLFNPGNRRSGRTLARHGIDLSGPVREGRILLAGWCDGDPLGNLPSWRNVKSTAVVVRRLIPAEGGP